MRRPSVEKAGATAAVDSALSGAGVTTPTGGEVTGLTMGSKKVRVYDLAKELKIDSKELVEICAKAGIPDKGSALASLTDDEVVRLKEFLNGRGGRATGARGPSSPTASATVATPAPPDKHSRENYIPPAGV